MQYVKICLLKGQHVLNSSCFHWTWFHSSSCRLSLWRWPVMSINVQPLVATLLPMSIVPTVNSVLENIRNNYTIFDQIKALPRCSVTQCWILTCVSRSQWKIFSEDIVFQGNCHVLGWGETNQHLWSEMHWEWIVEEVRTEVLI